MFFTSRQKKLHPRAVKSCYVWIASQIILHFPILLSKLYSDMKNEDRENSMSSDAIQINSNVPNQR